MEAMKKVFKGKWALSGGSKGGFAVAVQQAFYPDDADCYVSYCAPFLNYEHDTRMQEYTMTEALTPELRAETFHILFYCKKYKIIIKYLHVLRQIVIFVSIMPLNTL